jgi:aminoglycoside/choline kinase family phosphotransferase
MTNVKQNKIKNITNLVKKISDKEIASINKLAESASYREYYRITFTDKTTIIGAYNEDYKENVAFINYSKTFLNKNLNVAEILAVDLENSIYLLSDLGSFTLFDILTKERKGNRIPKNIVSLYKKSLKQLIDFQLIGNNLDYKDAYPRETFDEQSMFWDLNYFKYYFLKLAKIPFDEQLLENDFKKFAEHLLSYNTNYFMYRDFQTRNIMVKENKVYFIDFQGGRKGALQYDLASILFNSKANLPTDLRNELLDYYYLELTNRTEYKKGKFEQGFYAYALIRLLQAMGAYGFRGFYEKKSYFLNSIPFALKNVNNILDKLNFIENYPELKNVLTQK